METSNNIVKDNLDEICDALNVNLSSISHSCYLVVYTSNNLRKSVQIRFSLDKKDTWVNGYYLNSRYATCFVFANKDNTFSFEVSSSNHRETSILKLRKKTASKEKMIKHIVDTFKNIVEKSL